MSTVDVLFHLRKEEYFRRAEEADPIGNSAPVAKDAMAELCRHVLGQRRWVPVVLFDRVRVCLTISVVGSNDSFYPIFPPPLDFAGDVNLDVTHQELLRFETRAPDVLILPSRLKHFAKVRRIVRLMVICID
jgi:DNA polymerase alpha subunit B